jgi:sec-independent protein translocase protein TatA
MNILASLLNLAGPDLIVMLLIALLLFGSKRLPELARGMGQAFKEFHKAKAEIECELTRPEVTVQPALGQQPRLPAELPAVHAAVTQTAQVPPAAPQTAIPISPVAQPLAQVPPMAQAPPVAAPAEQVHPACQV